MCLLEGVAAYASDGREEQQIISDIAFVAIST